MRRTYRRSLVAFANLLLLLQAHFAAGQHASIDCDPSLRPIEGASGYAARGADPRCEGVYQSPVSATGLEVVSVTLGPLAFDIEADDQLVVSFDIEADDQLVVSLPDLGALDPDVVRVRAVAVPLKMYYRMDGLLAPGETMRWPVEAAIRPWKFTSAQLGAFGWIDRGGERVMIPVAVTPKGKPLAGSAGDIMIKLRSPVRLERLLWREIAPDGSVSDWRPVVVRPVQGGEVVLFELPAGPPGVVQLDFRAKRPNSDDWLALDLYVWRPAV